MKALIIYRDNVYATELISTYNKLSDYEVTIVIDNRTLHIDIITLRLKVLLNKNINIITVKEFLEGKIDNMKFDYIVGNPPYQKQIGNNKSIAIWPEIIIKCFDILKQNGTMNMIHPGGWRFVSTSSQKNLKQVKDIYYSNTISSIELFSYKHGMKTFNAQIDYDIISLIKTPLNSYTTEIKTESGICNTKLSDLKIIPTNNINDYIKLYATTNDNKINLIKDSLYHSQREHINKNGSSKYSFECVSNLPKNGEVKKLYSSKNIGHFGIPKIIFTKGGYNFILDNNGVYGVTEFGYGLVDTKENLPKILKVLKYDKFNKLLNSFAGLTANRLIDPNGIKGKILSTFRKDFWKDFYTNKMEQELIDEGVLDTNGNYIAV